MELRFYVILLVSFLLESTVTNIPLVFLTLFVYFVLFSKANLFLIAFLLGIILDVVLLRQIPLTSALLIIGLFVPTLYKRRFEASNIFFISIFSFLGSLFFLTVYQADYPILKSILSIFIAVLLFEFFKMKSSIGKRNY